MMFCLVWRFYKFDTLNELKSVLYERIHDYKQDYGALCFLYSLLLTKVLLFISYKDYNNHQSKLNIYSKKLEILKRELEESGESLIDPLHGHGRWAYLNFEIVLLSNQLNKSFSYFSQCLTNLLLCGIATSNVFDGDKSLEGLRK